MEDGIYPGQRIHLELRRDTFVVYNDGGSQRIELPYGDTDEVIDQLTRVTMSNGYIRAGKLPANRSADGHILKDAPRKLRPASTTRPRMRFICGHCGMTVNDRRQTQLSQREFNEYLCSGCYLIARQKLYPDNPRS